MQEYKPQAPKHYTSDIVWGCAAAAHRINNGYVKEDQWQVNGVASSFLAVQSNKNLVKKWLREEDYSDVTEADIAQGQAYRRHFAGYTLLAIRGPLNDFQQQALKIANIDEFTGRNMLEFAIVACLPSVAERDDTRNQIKKEVYSSTQLKGDPGDTIVSEVLVISSTYSKAYEKYKVVGVMGDSYVDFWTNISMTKDTTVKIKAKIKTLRDDKTTQLNYVKKA